MPAMGTMKTAIQSVRRRLVNPAVKDVLVAEWALEQRIIAMEHRAQGSTSIEAQTAAALMIAIEHDLGAIRTDLDTLLTRDDRHLVAPVSAVEQHLAMVAEGLREADPVEAHSAHSLMIAIEHDLDRIRRGIEDLAAGLEREAPVRVPQS